MTDFASDNVKRNLSSMIDRAYALKAPLHFMGNPPLLLLRPLGNNETANQYQQISIDAAKADWSNITLACSIHNVTLLITRRGKPAAIIERHPHRRHPCDKYQSGESVNSEWVANQLESLVRKIRKGVVT